MAKRDVEQEPNGDMIQEVYDAVQEFWKPQFTKDSDLIALIGGKHKIKAPDTQNKDRKRKVEPERMESREAARSVNQIRAFYTAPAAIQADWIGETAPKSEKTGERVSRGINEIINQLNPPTDSPLKRERWWMVAIGRAARLIVPGNAYWWDFPEEKPGQTIDEWWEEFSNWRRNAPLPLVWKDLLPHQTFPPTFGRMDDEVISWLDLSWHELDEVFSDAELAKLGDDTDAVRSQFADAKGRFRLAIFSNVKWLGYAVMGKDKQAPTQLLRTYEHRLQRPAIRILPGMTSGIKEPGEYWQSVLEDVRDLIPQVDKRLSEAATASKFDALPMFKGRFHQDSEAAKMERFFEGDIIPLQAGIGDEKDEDLEPLFHPQFGEKTLTLAQFGLQRIERITGAVESLEGAFGPSGQPAWARNFAHDIAKAKFAELTDGVVAGDVDAADSIMRSIVSFGETIRVPTHLGHGKASPRITLTPKEMENYRLSLKGEYSLRVVTNRRADLDLAVSIMERTRQSNLPIPMPFIFSTLMDVEDPYKMYEESLVWDFLMSEDVRQLHQQELVRELKGDIAGDEGMAVEEFLRESAEWPPEVRMAVLREVLGPNAVPPPGTPTPTAGVGAGGAGSFYGGGGGMAPDTQGRMRAAAPFSVRPGGPKPEGGA